MATAYVEIPLSGEKAAGCVALIDPDDYELVIGHSWNINKGYAITSLWVAAGKRRITSMHRLITGWEETDHENRRKLDNRRFNLRIGPKLLNSRNTAGWSRRASSYKGVSRNGSGWTARIYCEGVQYRLGTFRDEEDAARAYDAKAIEIFGEYAYLNFPSAA